MTADDDLPAGLIARLRSRRSEIEHALIGRMRSSDLGTAADAEDYFGLRRCVSAFLDYILTGIESGAERSATIPSELVAQARRAARNDVALEMLLLRCASASRLLVGVMMAEASHVPGDTMREALNVNGLLIERLMAGVAIEHRHESELAKRSQGHRVSEVVRRLLAGDSVETTGLEYDFDGWHLGIIATGTNADSSLSRVAAACDRNVLAVDHGGQTVWGWLGGRGKFEVSDLERQSMPDDDVGVAFAIGEPGVGIDGWRLTHLQAQAAALVALYRPRSRTRYADDMLLAAALRDETLARSLTETFLMPFASQRDGGVALRATLRAYFAVDQNVTQAGTQLGIARQTVERRLEMVEQILGRALPTCLVELDVALRLDDLAL